MLIALYAAIYMIERINRQTVFELHKNITEEISGIQRALYDNDLSMYEGETEKNEYLELFDAKHIEVSKIKKYYKVLAFEYSDLNTFTKVLSDNLLSLMTELDIRNLIIISHYKINLFGNLKIKHKPLKQAYEDLYKIIGNFEYKEALRIDLLDFPSILNIAFWIERIDPSGPEYLFFYDEKNSFAFYLCKYGKVHTIEFENEILIDKILKKHNWKVIDGRCYDNFSESGKIEGRTIKI